MFQRDYIMRYIELMGDFTRRVAELMDELRQMRLLDDGCKRYCGLAMTAIEALDSDSLIELLAPPARLFASELLYTKATLLKTNEECAIKLKSLRLLASMYSEGALCELRASRLEELKEELLPNLNADDLMLCAEFLSQGGEYANMEDAIFQAVEVSGTIERQRHTQRGVMLLYGASLESEQSLAKAGTSPLEMQEAAKELMELSERLSQKEKRARNERESDP